MFSTSLQTKSVGPAALVKHNQSIIWVKYVFRKSLLQKDIQDSMLICRPAES